MADAADALTVGPTAARLAMSAAISGKSSLTGSTCAMWLMETPPPRPAVTVMGTPEWRSRSMSRATVRSVTPSS
jgi:hypothetical protein